MRRRSIVCGACEDYMIWRSPDEVQLKPAAFRGRGELRPSKVSHAKGRTVPETVAAIDKRSSGLIKAYRRVDAMAKVLRKAMAEGCGQYPQEAQNTWDVACSGGKTMLRNDVWEEESPTLEQLEALSGALRNASQKHLDKVRSDSVLQWDERMRKAIKSASPGPVYDHVKGKQGGCTRFVTRKDGTNTADLREMDELLRGQDAWGGVFRMYGEETSESEPEWEPFLERYLMHIECDVPCEHHPLDEDSLRLTLNKMQGGKAAGWDSWQVAELKELPSELLALIAEFLNAVEELGKWPDVIALAMIALIPKGQGSLPLEQRPITLTSVIYRLWAATRLREVIRWQSAWAPRRMAGYRENRGTEHLYWELCLDIERTLHRGGLDPETPASLYIVNFDYSKCFDRLPRAILMQLVRRMGLPEKVVASMDAMYSNMSMRFRLPSGLGKPFRATNGILQGCPLSVVFLNALVAVWMRTVNSEVTGAETSGYADDTTVTAEDISSRDKSACLTKEFCGFTGQRLNMRKGACMEAHERVKSSTCSSTDVPLATVTAVLAIVARLTRDRLFVDGELIPHFGYIKCLGVLLRPDVERNGLLEERIDSVEMILGKIKRLRISTHDRAKVAATIAVPKALYGVAVQDLKKTKLAQLTRLLEEAIMRRPDGRGRE